VPKASLLMKSLMFAKNMG